MEYDTPPKYTPKDRLSFSEKNANKKAWYRQKADELDNSHYDRSREINGVSAYQRMKVNYDLFNNIINMNDLEYVCKPHGSDMGKLPANMSNKDICSGKIKALLGMEMKRPVNWTLLAVNRDATTRKEQEEFSRLREYVTSEIMMPIRQKMEQEQAEQSKGEPLNPDEIEQINAQVEEELKAQTPEEVKKYMEREHQDPAEVQGTQLLEYLYEECGLKKKFNTAFKHGLLSAKQVMYLGVFNDKPHAWNVNSMRINSDETPDLENIEDGEWVTCEYIMTPSQLVRLFGPGKDGLTTAEIDRIYQSWSASHSLADDEDLFAIDERTGDYLDSAGIRVLHCVFKAPRKLGFLTYEDENGEIQETIVDEAYKINTDFGDIEIDWEWIPEVYETWKIKVADPIYVKMQPLPGQFKDIDNLYYSKLPYYGVLYDNMNSVPTALMDRMINHQYYYNIIMYRIELLTASDKGKKVLMNIGTVPTSKGIGLKKWQYYFESSPFMYYNPKEEGSDYNDANTIAKVIDLSLASDIQKYMEIAEYVRNQLGQSIGITDQVEGQIGPNEAVSNSRQNLIQSSHILEPYFELHNEFKRNVLVGLLELAKVAYAGKNSEKLSYVVDDVSMKMFTLDMGLIEASRFGLFVSNSTKADEARSTIRELAHAAMQNQKVELSDVMSVIRLEDVTQAEEVLKVAENARMDREDKAQENESRSREEMAEKAREFIREEHEMEKEKIILKEEERRKTVIAQSALVGMSFNPELDQDNDGTPDFLEIAKFGVDADIKRGKFQLDKDKFNHEKEVDNKKLKNDAKSLENEDKKLAIQQAQNQQNSLKA